METHFYYIHLFIIFRTNNNTYSLLAQQYIQLQALQSHQIFLEMKGTKTKDARIIIGK